jgi:hypothetical protein
MPAADDKCGSVVSESSGERELLGENLPRRHLVHQKYQIKTMKIRNIRRLLSTSPIRLYGWCWLLCMAQLYVCSLLISTHGPFCGSESGSKLIYELSGQNSPNHVPSFRIIWIARALTEMWMSLMWGTHCNYACPEEAQVDHNPGITRNHMKGASMGLLG